ncbi:hypothetical protein OUZ56_018519 [Daphnia magna]|uniref:Uncharacterized protein n=1 Tax=Daphnia magna TaxID=35525 RepID=A0ABQ9Z923_9CRUS|nr:hypothetical protein OUZ56_018519 [Daphnia magna]
MVLLMSTRGNQNGSRGSGCSRGGSSQGRGSSRGRGSSGSGHIVQSTNFSNTALAQGISLGVEEDVLLRLLAEEEDHELSINMETEDVQSDQETQLPSTSKLPECAHSIPIFEQSKWPEWRKNCSSGKVLAKCKFCSSGGSSFRKQRLVFKLSTTYQKESRGRIKQHFHQSVT